MTQGINLAHLRYHDAQLAKQYRIKQLREKWEAEDGAQRQEHEAARDESLNQRRNYPHVSIRFFNSGKTNPHEVHGT